MERGLRTQRERRRKGAGRNQQVCLVILCFLTHHRADTSWLRHRVQAAAAEGLAADIDTQNSPSYTFPHWHLLCAHRCPLDLGE